MFELFSAVTATSVSEDLAVIGVSLGFAYSHLDPMWCRENLPWHYDHHMGPNQDMNYGVTTDWVDRLMGTREVYLGTQREVRDTVRRMAVAQAQAG